MQVGLGKTLEVLYLTLAHPAGAWASESLPLEQSGVETPSEQLGLQVDKDTDWAPVPVRATLVVAPATLLDQWQAEIRQHAPGLRCAIYTGCGAAGSAVQPRYTDGGDLMMDGGGRLSDGPVHKRRRTSSAAAAAAAVPEAPREIRRPMLAASRADLFIAPTNPNEDGASTADLNGGSAAPAVDVAKCDIILASYETFRKEVSFQWKNPDFLS